MNDRAKHHYVKFVSAKSCVYKSINSENMISFHASNASFQSQNYFASKTSLKYTCYIDMVPTVQYFYHDGYIT